MYKVGESVGIELMPIEFPPRDKVSNVTYKNRETQTTNLQQQFWVKFKNYIDNFEENDNLIDSYLAPARKQHWSEFRYKNIKSKWGHGSFTISKESGDIESEKARMELYYDLFKETLGSIYSKNITHNSFKSNSKSSTCSLEFNWILKILQKKPSKIFW